jgi:PhnB protein
MRITPYLSFDGNCAEAFRFYESCLRGKIENLLTWETMPEKDRAQMPGIDLNRIMHASLTVGDQAILGADAPQGATKPAGFCVCISLKDMAEGKRVFDELSAGGSVQMPFSPTFWSPGFGMATDRFGIPWMINCEYPA